MKRKHILMLGALVGALVGLLTAYAIVQRMDEIHRRGKKARLRARPADWFKLGMAVLGVARQFSRLLTPD